MLYWIIIFGTSIFFRRAEAVQYQIELIGWMAGWLDWVCG